MSTTIQDMPQTRQVGRRSSPSAWIVYYLAATLPLAFYITLGLLQYRSPVLNGDGSIAFVIFQIAVMSFPVVSSAISLTGVLVFGPPRDRQPGEDWQWNPDFHLILAYVSRGHQPETLNRATTQSQNVVDQLGVNYELEVVTDIEVPPEYRLQTTQGATLYYVVPEDYQTRRGARYKARALQYLLEQRPDRLLDEEDVNIWILHMDEESVLTPECVLGIQEFIEKHDLRKSSGAIGQGEIKYNSHAYGDHPLIAAIDAQRTGGGPGNLPDSVSRCQPATDRNAWQLCADACKNRAGNHLGRGRVWIHH